MRDLPETRDSLLIRIRDAADGEAWAEFVALYRPMIYRFARRRGFQDADAQDLVQRVLLSVSSQVSEWNEPGGAGHFRRWLARVARNALIDAVRRQRPDAALGGTDGMDDLATSPAPLEAAIEREYQCEVFRRAARQVRSELDEASWLAFWLTAVEGQSIQETARRLEKTAGAIYTARSRVMLRLQQRVRDHEL